MSGFDGLGKVVIKLNKEGVGELLRCDGVRDDLLARGQRVADAAGAGFEAKDATTARARTIVYTDDLDAMKDEAEFGVLETALWAAQ